MPPPQLPRDTPRLDILHPVEEGLLPRLGHDLDRARPHRLDRGLRQGRRIDIPLVGQPRLDHHARAIAIGRLDRTRLGFMLDAVLVDMRDEEALGLQPRDDRLARLRRGQPEQFGRDQPIGHLDDLRPGIEHVEHLARLDPRPLADLEVVEVVPRRDLDRARPQFGIGMVVGHDRDQSPGDRQLDLLADQMRVTFVRSVHRDGHIGEHRLGPRRRDLDEAAGIRQRIAQMPEAALDLARLDLEVADRGAEARIPVHQPLVAVEQAFFVQVDEHLQHGLGKALVHREALVRPVHRATEPAELLRDLAAALLFPFPHLRDEFLAGEVGALLLALGHLPLDHHLRRDAGMVGADHPQRVLALQPRVADENVLQRVVERMADMERARDVGRRVDDRPRLGAGAVGAEQAVRLPMRVPALLEFGGVEGFGELGHSLQALAATPQKKRAARWDRPLRCMVTRVRPRRAARSWALPPPWRAWARPGAAPPCCNRRCSARRPWVRHCRRRSSGSSAYSRRCSSCTR